MLKPDRLITVLALGAVAALPRPARAQELADVCKAVTAATVGQWASFDATGNGSGTSKLRLAVVGSERAGDSTLDRKSTRLNSSHLVISYAVFCLKKKKKKI